jgi:HlyD family secretion protein
VATADAALVKARNDLQELTDGPEPADVAAAEQAVATAESQLAQAQSARIALDDSPSAADLAAAESAVASAESALTAAENTAKNADNTVNSAAASLKSAEASYCVADNTPAFCSSQATPISSADEGIVSAALSGANATLASGVISANNTYLNALNASTSADAAVESAERAVQSAEEKLAQVQAGPAAEDIAAADAAVASAQAGLTAAQENLADAQRGATQEQVSTARSAVTSAEASLAAAVAKRNEARRGPEANALRQASEAVRTAQLAVEASQIRLKDTQIVAPFDGTVAVVNITPGEFVGPAATEPAIVLLTPNAMLLEMDIGETDYASMRVGLGGAVRFDGLPGRFYPFVISELGLSPNVEQGVVTYPVKASLIVTGDAPRPVPGMNASGQLTLSTRDNVLAVPARAIRRRGTEQVVDVRRDGVVVEQVITTGVSDLENVEVLTGLAEGDVLVVPALRAADAEEEEAEPTIPGGIR